MRAVGLTVAQKSQSVAKPINDFRIAANVLSAGRSSTGQGFSPTAAPATSRRTWPNGSTASPSNPFFPYMIGAVRTRCQSHVEPHQRWRERREVPARWNR